MVGFRRLGTFPLCLSNGAKLETLQPNDVKNPFIGRKICCMYHILYPMNGIFYFERMSYQKSH